MSSTAAEEHLENPAAGNSTASQRRFVIFIDYLNLEASLRGAGIGFEKFDWLLLPILEYGKVTWVYVFVPQLPGMRLPILAMSNTWNFRVIQCPREFEGPISKQKDSVDAVIIDEGISHVYHSDCTDIIIISGDADFARLATRAMNEGKQVHVMSTLKALSGDWRQLENPRIKVHIIKK